jgi:hypothetical protein
MSQKIIFRIPEKIKHILPSKIIIAIEILDELINDLFGIHFLESEIDTINKPVVKSKIEKKSLIMMTPSHSALSSHRSSHKSLRPSQRSYSNTLHNSAYRPGRNVNANDHYDLPQL